MIYKFNLAIASAISAGLLLSSCAGTGPAMPQVPVMPGKGKSYTVFQKDDAYCQNAAQNAIAGQSPGLASNSEALGSAVVGTGLGAATGALIGAAAGNRPGTGAAIGAGSGLLLGSAVGQGRASDAGNSIQSRYDRVYAQCMSAKGHQVGVGANVAPVHNGGPIYGGPIYY